MAKQTTADAYIEAGKTVSELGRAIDTARRKIMEANKSIEAIEERYQKAYEELAEVVNQDGFGDPLGLLSIGQDHAVLRARSVASGDDGRVGKGKNQEAILNHLEGASEGQTQAAIVEGVKAALGGGSPPSITQATSSLLKAQKIRRTGRRGSYLYWSLDHDSQGNQTVIPTE